MRYCLALDLGSEGDFTALSILKRIERFQGEKHKNNSPLWKKDSTRNIVSELHLGKLERLPLQTPYPEIVQTVKEIVNRPEFVSQIFLVVEQNSIGLPVIQMMVNEGLAPIGIITHGGDAMRPSERGYRVPKRDLVTALLMAFQTKRIKLAPPDKMPMVAVLEKELNNFRPKVNQKTGHETFEAFEEKVHDDLVMSLAMNVWWMDKIHGTSTLYSGGEDTYPSWSPGKIRK